MEARSEAESAVVADPTPERVDLNRANAEELSALPGIGPRLAERVIAYRQAHGPFLFEEDITQVPGVGASLFQRLADRLTVTMPSAAELSSEEPPSLAETYGRFAESMDLDPAPEEHVAQEVATVEPIAEPEGVAAQPEPPVVVQVPPPIPFDDEGLESAPETVIVEAEASESDLDADDWASAPIPFDDEVAEVVPEPEAPEPSAQPAPRQPGRFRWFWTALLGAVFGGIFGLLLSLMVFAGINGAIDLNRSHAVRGVNGRLNELNTELSAVRQDVSTLQGDVEGIRRRVEVLSGLTARMEQAEETLATFTKEIQALQADTDALTSSLDQLDTEVATMGETLDAVEEQTEKANTFFERLQELLLDVFGGAAPEPEGAAPRGRSDVPTKLGGDA